MKREILIHKVIITAEAKFDYEETMALGKLPKTDIKNLIEDYLSLKDGEYQACDVKYFSVKYLDDVGDVLKLFFYRGIRLGNMQMWKLAGICREQDWHSENDDEGLIRQWLKQKVDDLGKEKDWVKEVQKKIDANICCCREILIKDKNISKKIRNGDFYRKE